MAIRFEKIYERDKELLVGVGFREVAFCDAVKEGVICGRVFFSSGLSERMLAARWNMEIVWAYSSSTRYGAALNCALRATLILGPARAPIILDALSRNKALGLSSERGTRIV
jgi:hypothetical protein